jgi:hypothetical protein
VCMYICKIFGMQCRYIGGFTEFPSDGDDEYVVMLFLTTQ